MLEKEALMVRALATERALTAFEHARVEAQATRRQQGAGLTQFSQQVLPEAGTVCPRHQRQQHQRVFQHMQRVGEAEAIRIQACLRSRGSHEHADGIMSQHQAVQLLQHAQRRAAAQGKVGQPLMGARLVDAEFDLPALMIQQDQFLGGSLLRIQQGSDQPMHSARISPAAVARTGHACQGPCQWRVKPILDDAQGERGLQPWTRLGGQLHQVAAILKDLGGLGEHARFQASQSVGSTGTQGGTDGTREQATIQQHEHVLLQRAHQPFEQMVFTDATGSKQRIHQCMRADFGQVEAAGLRIRAGGGIAVQAPEESGIGRRISHVFQRTIDGHQPEAKGECPRGLWAGKGPTHLPEESAQHANTQGLSSIAQGSFGGRSLATGCTQPAPGARKMRIERLQRVARKQAQQDHQVDHQQVRQFAFPLFPAIMLGQQVSHHLAWIHLLQGGDLNLLAQLVSGVQLRYLKRHRRTPFWLVERRFLPVCQNWSPFSTYFNGIGPKGKPPTEDLNLFIGEPEDVPDRPFGLGLPNRRAYARRYYHFVGYVLGFDPATYADRSKIRAALGYDERPLIVASIGGTAVGKDLLALCAAAYPHIRQRVEDVHMILVCGPGVDPASLRVPEGVEVRGYVPRLFEHLAACDLAIVQGGGTTTLELTALQRPFIYFPLEGHFEQELTVAKRLARQRAGQKLVYSQMTPETLADTAVRLLGSQVTWPPLAANGAQRAAELITALLPVEHREVVRDVR